MCWGLEASAPAGVPPPGSCYLPGTRSPLVAPLLWESWCQGMATGVPILSCQGHTAKAGSSVGASNSLTFNIDTYVPAYRGCHTPGVPPSAVGWGSETTERGDAWLEFPAHRGALHTGLTFCRRGCSAAPRAGLLVLVFPLPHEYLCAQGSNIKWQIKIIMAGQERNPGRNEKALYLVPLIAPFPCFFNKRLCFFILHLTLQIMQSVPLHIPGQPQKAAKVFIPGHRAQPHAGSSITVEVGDSGCQGS